MAISTTIKKAEVVSRNVEKQAGVKHVPAPVVQAHTIPPAATPQEGAKADSRDSSPDSRAHARRPFDNVESADGSRVASTSSLFESEPEAKDARTRPFPRPPVQITLDVCPSFAEQNPQRTKPLWLERHGTLQTVHNTSFGELWPASPAPGTARTPATGPAVDAADSQTQWLPRWDIARSYLWLLVEDGLLLAQAHAKRPQDGSPEGADTGNATPPAANPNPVAAATASTPYSPALPSVPESDPAPLPPETSATVATDAALGPPSGPLNPQPHPGSATGTAATASTAFAAAAATTGTAATTTSSITFVSVPISRATPFAARPTQLALVHHQSPQALGVNLAAADISSFTRRANSALTCRVPSMLRRSCSLAVRACPPTPRGLGPSAPGLAFALLDPSSPRHVVTEPGLPPVEEKEEQQQQPRNTMSQPASGLTAAGSGSSAGGDDDGDRGGPSIQHQPHQHQHVAYAAGLAAGTSAAAGVSHALQATVGGLTGGGLLAAAAAADPHMSLVSTALDLGTNMLQAGTSFCLNRVQSMAVQKTTVAAAEAVLGPAAPVSVRAELRRRLRATLAGASVLWFLVNLHGMAGTLAHLDFDHDFATITRVVMNLVTNGPQVLENCRELLQIGVAVTLGVAQRNHSAAALGGPVGGGAEGAGGYGADDGGATEDLYAMAMIETRS